MTKSCNPHVTEYSAKQKGTQPDWLNPIAGIGAGGRSRTDMSISPLDFESSASTSFTTPAWIFRY